MSADTSTGQRLRLNPIETLMERLKRESPNARIRLAKATEPDGEWYLSIMLKDRESLVTWFPPQKSLRIDTQTMGKGAVPDNYVSETAKMVWVSLNK